MIKDFNGCGIYLPNHSNINMDTKVYKYMKLSHLLSLIHKKEFYVPNRARFSDLRDKQGFEKHIPKHQFDFSISPVYSNRKDQNFYKNIEDERKKAFSLCISCWTMNLNANESINESFLMWKAYGNNEIGCRIGTTIENLINSIIHIPYDIIISEVNYYGELTGINNYIFGKSIYYESEQEVRMAVLSENEHHIQLEINPYSMLQEIILSPFIDPLMENFIINMVKENYPQLSERIFPSKVVEYQI